MNIHDLDLNLLKVFDAIYAERSISAAAQQLGVTQPAVSSSLRRLRTFTGDTLFYQSGRGVAPTRAAMSLAVPVKHILDTLEASLSELRTFDAATSKRSFRVGVNDIVSSALIPTLIDIVRHEAPGVTLEFIQQPKQGPAQALALGELDIGFLPKFALTPDLHSHRVWTERFCIIVSRRNPIANTKTLSLDSVSQMQFIVQSQVPKLLEFVDSIFQSAGVDRSILCRVPEIQSIYSIVATSDLAAVVGRSFTEMYNRDGNLVAFEPPVDIPEVEAHVAWKASDEDDEGSKWIRGHAVSVMGSAFKMLGKYD